MSAMGAKEHKRSGDGGKTWGGSQQIQGAWQGLTRFHQ